MSQITRRHALRIAAGATVLGMAAASAAPALAFSPAAQAAGAPVKLVNVEHDSRPLDNAAYAAVYQAFKQQNPDIDIEF